MADPERKPWALDSARVRSSFASAAASYDAAAVLQQEVGARLLERLAVMRVAPREVLDLGCGTGRTTAGLRAHYPEARVLAADHARPMLLHARGHGAPPGTLLCADANRLPLADRSVDVLFSNLMLQWCMDPGATFAELRRVLRPGGLLLFSTFGPDTLGELRASWAEADGHNHVNAFFDLHDLGDLLVHTRFADPVMDREVVTLTYTDVHGLLRDLKALGAHNSTAGRPRGLTGRRRLAVMVDTYETFRRPDGRLPATWEVLYGHAWIPPDDAAAGAIPAASLRRRPG
jgi:malonyl-CoA O-methyltransferase